MHGLRLEPNFPAHSVIHTWVRLRRMGSPVLTALMRLLGLRTHRMILMVASKLIRKGGDTFISPLPVRLRVYNVPGVMVIICVARIGPIYIILAMTRQTRLAIMA